jgi:uncharacterized protein
MAGNQPEEHVRQPVLYQSWRQVAFLHFRYDPAEVQRLLPDGLMPDVLDGSAWVSLTPFRVEGFRPRWIPALPGVATFAETNLRTYVRDGRGVEGLWFLSIDVSSIANAGGGRLIGAPYFLSSMSITGDTSVRYQCRRMLGASRARHDFTVHVGEQIPDGGVSDLEGALVGRWRAYTRLAGHLLEVPVEHEPWSLWRATVTTSDVSLIPAAGLPMLNDPALVHYSATGVNARLGMARGTRRARLRTSSIAHDHRSTATSAS